MELTAIDVGGIVVALIAAFGAVAAQRSASKAQQFNTEVSKRLEAEKEAYERARAFDIETINRQDKEMKKLREENDSLRDDMSRIKTRLRHLENERLPAYERLVNELERRGVRIEGLNFLSDDD